jgi:hypothetical protein
LALRELLPLGSAIDRIRLGREYHVEEWLPDAYVEVCQRAEPLSLADADQMTKEDVVRIFQARESARSGSAEVTLGMAKEAVARTLNNDRIVNVGQGGEVNVPILADIGPVDDSLMDVLDIWTNLSSWLGFGIFNPSESFSIRYRDYRGQLVVWIQRSDLHATSIGHFLSVILRLSSSQPHVCADICTGLRQKICAQIEGSLPGQTEILQGQALFDNLLHKQCEVLLRSWDSPPEGYQQSLRDHQNGMAQFFGLIADAGLTNQQTLRLFYDKIESLKEANDAASTSQLCMVLTSLGKALDNGEYHRTMDDIFSKLRRLVLDEKLKDVRRAIIVSTLVC